MEIGCPSTVVHTSGLRQYLDLPFRRPAVSGGANRPLDKFSRGSRGDPGQPARPSARHLDTTTADRLWCQESACLAGIRRAPRWPEVTVFARGMPSLILARAVLLLGGRARPPRPRRVSAHHPATVFVAGDSTAATWPADVAPRPAGVRRCRVFLTRPAPWWTTAAVRRQLEELRRLGPPDADPGRHPAGRLPAHLVRPQRREDRRPGALHRPVRPRSRTYLRQYIDGARRPGRAPVLVTPVERRRFDATGVAYRQPWRIPGRHARARCRAGTCRSST